MNTGLRVRDVRTGERQPVRWKQTNRTLLGLVAPGTPFTVDFELAVMRSDPALEGLVARYLAPGEYELELDLSGFLRGDPETRWASHEIAIKNRILTPNEVRRVEGWNARDGGDGFPETEGAA